MRKAEVYVQDKLAGILEELDHGFSFSYLNNYSGPPVSLTIPTTQKRYIYSEFPPFFEGLLPEGMLLNALLRTEKIDKNDFFAQLVVVGGDMIGDTTVKAIQ